MLTILGLWPGLSILQVSPVDTLPSTLLDPDLLLHVGGWDTVTSKVNRRLSAL